MGTERRGSLTTGDRGRDDAVTCPIAAHCGGCALIGSDHATQLAAKRDRLASALAARAELRGVPVDDCVPAPRRAAYRNRAKLAVFAAADGVRIGLRRRGGGEVIDLAPCRVESAPILERLEPVRSWLAEQGLAAPAGPVKYVDLRETADGGCHLTFVLACEPAASPDLPIDALLKTTAGVEGLSVNFNPRESSYVFGEVTRTLYGARSFAAAVPGVLPPIFFEVPATGFFQVAPALLPAIHARMDAHLRPEGVLFDLYCGVGTHGLSLARAAGARGTALQIVGIEESRAAAACARRNADRLGCAASYRAGRVERELSRIDDRGARFAVLNPGRAGCRPAALAALTRTGVERAAYLSCDVETLARDLVALEASGLRAQRATPLDLMPQTDQVETLALLARR